MFPQGRYGGELDAAFAEKRRGGVDRVCRLSALEDEGEVLPMDGGAEGDGGEVKVVMMRGSFGGGSVHALAGAGSGSGRGGDVVEASRDGLPFLSHGV